MSASHFHHFLLKTTGVRSNRTLLNRTKPTEVLSKNVLSLTSAVEAPNRYVLQNKDFNQAVTTPQKQNSVDQGQIGPLLDAKSKHDSLAYAK